MTKNVTKCNFWMGGPILKIRVPKQVPRRQEIFLYISHLLIGPQFDTLFTKIFCLNKFFVNTGSKWGPVKIWMTQVPRRQEIFLCNSQITVLFFKVSKLKTNECKQIPCDFRNERLRDTLKQPSAKIRKIIVLKSEASDGKQCFFN